MPGIPHFGFPFLPDGTVFGQLAFLQLGPGTGTFNVPDGTKQIIAIAVGGGQGGQGGSTPAGTHTGGISGYCGGWNVTFISNPPAVLPYTVGAGGAGGVPGIFPPGGTNGASGGDVILNGTTIAGGGTNLGNGAGFTLGTREAASGELGGRGAQSFFNLRDQRAQTALAPRTASGVNGITGPNPGDGGWGGGFNANGGNGADGLMLVAFLTNYYVV